MRQNIELFSILFFIMMSSTWRMSHGEHPDSFLTTVELIQRYGFPVEVHDVTTEDNYILTVFRIPHGTKGKGVNKKPILFMHGLYGTAENYLVNGMNNGSLAYLMADNGYDVWLGNSRGNQNGRNHKFLDPDDADFWKFSWHEIGMYDVPALVDYILQKTKKKKVQYVGHSQGGAVFFVMTSMRPEYQKKISLASLLAPAVFMKNFNNVFLSPFVPRYKELLQAIEMTNLYEIPPKPISLRDIVLHSCNNFIIRFRDMCEIILHISMGGDSGHFNQEMVPISARFIPTVSALQVVHFAVTIATGHFRPIDYGEEKNMEKYGKPVPEDYPVQDVAVPTAFYYSLGDTLVNHLDIEDVCRNIKKCVRQFLMKDEKWTHVDFIIANNAATELNKPLLELANQY